jgi:beta-glucosidase
MSLIDSAVNNCNNPDRSVVDSGCAEAKLKCFSCPEFTIFVNQNNVPNQHIDRVAGIRRGKMATTSVIKNEDSSSNQGQMYIEDQIDHLIGRMTLAEKIGQMCQVDAGITSVSETLADAVRSGRIGSVINQVDVTLVNELQRIAVNESRLGIPLLIGRDVIHGFQTVMPIPLGQAASFNPGLVSMCAEMSALEAASTGINWTFAPMLDVARDPRWGRVAESFGEDPFLTSSLGAAMVRGFQGDNLADTGRIAACAKHFAGYGAVESGQDYTATNIPENELRNTYLPPFKAAIEAGARTVMTSFSDVNGVPATGNEFLLRQILRNEWGFNGLVVSDWNSIAELCTHGFAADNAHAACEAVTAGVSMEMAGTTYTDHLERLVAESRVDEELIDAAVAEILRVKFELDLFENPFTDPRDLPEMGSDRAKEIAYQAAVQSLVLLKNQNSVLPLCSEWISSIALLGPLADAAYEQLGTWIFDGKEKFSVTVKEAISGIRGGTIEVNYSQAMETSRSRKIDFDSIRSCIQKSDVVVLCLGEESILSGEAHCRADIGLPGAQAELVAEARKFGKPVIAVIMAGRPLTLENIVDHVDALIYAWHPGSMAGPAITDVLFGDQSPSGKLPVTLPRHVGQVPIYYGRKSGGKPPNEAIMMHIDQIDARAPQTSLGMCSFHLDTMAKPLYPFGYGLSYTKFHYSDLSCSHPELPMDGKLRVGVSLENTGPLPGTEVVQLYVRDLVGNVTRPVRELKAFERITLAPGEQCRVEFLIHPEMLAFFDRHQRRIVEAGEFHVWVGGSSEDGLQGKFILLPESH